MELLIVKEFVDLCMKNETFKAKETFKKNKEVLDINKIFHDTNTSKTQGPYCLFECMCILNHIDFVKWFIEIGVSPLNYNNGFMSACQYNNFEIIKYLNDNCGDVPLGFQTAFLTCCYQGNFELLKWLYINTDSKIDIHVHNETPFIYAIAESHFDIAKWLYHISITDEKIIDIHADNDSAFTYACSNGRLDICEWLYLISNNSIDKRIGIQYANVSNNQELIKWLEN
jgi:ankyrin repeat protein